jgi:hypothetical protein
VRFDRTKFDIIVRIRQAIGKKETETLEETRIVLEKIFTPFNEWAAPQRASEAQRPAENIKNPMLAIAKEVRQDMALPKPQPKKPVEPVQAQPA